MTQGVHGEASAQMGLPLPNGKLAMWLFLVTEIMFFTALIGTYVLFRSASQSPARQVINHGQVEQVRDAWPKPKDVHLEESVGAFNTFVLICSSVTIVLAHYSASNRNFPLATKYIAATFLLGLVFLGVKAYEYRAKFAHQILPGQIGESLPGRKPEVDKQYYMADLAYVLRVKEQLQKLTSGITDENKGEKPETIREAYELRKKIESAQLPLPQVGAEVNHLLHEAEKRNQSLSLPPTIPHGNLWASCYFVLTGIHAIHVLGGVVILGIIWLMGVFGRLGSDHVNMLEVTGLYWHFVDIVWIFLFPLLYLV